MMEKEQHDVNNMGEKNEPQTQTATAMSPRGNTQTITDIHKNSYSAKVGVSKKAMLFPTALLPNAEREELHSEIYTYFKWLEQSIINSQSGRRASQLGYSLTAIQSILGTLSDEIRSVGGDAIVLNKVSEQFAKNDRAPFLERHCEIELKKRLYETKDVELGIGRVLKSWDERCADLTNIHKDMNNMTYQEMNAKYDGLGDWLGRQRALYAKQDENFMKSKYRQLGDIPGFQWIQPKIKKIAAAAAKNKSKNKKPSPFPVLPKRPPVKKAAKPAAKHKLQGAVAAYYNPAHPFPPYHPGPPPRHLVGTARPVPPAAVTKPKKKCQPRYDFEEGLQKLVEYKNEHGDCNPPNRSRLGRWAYTIRQSWKEMNGRYSNNINWEPTENNDASNMNNDDNPGDDNNASGNNNNNSGIDTLAHAAAKTEEERVVSKIISVECEPGKLGLSVQFPEETDEGGFDGAMVVTVYDNCPFKSRVKPGDRIIMIDGMDVQGPDDLAIGAEKMRIIGISVKRKKEASEKVRAPTKLFALNEEHIERLASIGFNLEMRRLFRSWDDSFNDLLAYYQLNGHFKVPRTYHTPVGNHNLGDWVHRQRFRYTKKDPQFMKERVPTLEAVGFEWKPQKSHWEERFKELIDYKQKFGHVNVPCNNSKTNEYRALGRWVASMRFTKFRLDEKERSGGGDEAQEEKPKTKRGGHQNDYLTKERQQVRKYWLHTQNNHDQLHLTIIYYLLLYFSFSSQLVCADNGYIFAFSSLFDI